MPSHNKKISLVVNAMVLTSFLSYLFSFKISTLTILHMSSLQNSPNPPYKAAAAAAKSLQSRPTLCDPIDGSPPGSPVPGILQARTLEWVAISFSNA